MIQKLLERFCADVVEISDRQIEQAIRQVESVSNMASRILSAREEIPSMETNMSIVEKHIEAAISSLNLYAMDRNQLQDWRWKFQRYTDSIVDDLEYARTHVSRVLDVIDHDFSY